MSVVPEPRWVENAPAGGARLPDVRVLWRRRELIGLFALRDVRSRYKQAALGSGWALLNPLIGVAAFTLVFHRVAGVGSAGVPYPLFAFVGLSAWTFFATGVSRGSSALILEPNLVTKVAFPRITAVVGAVVAQAISLGVALAFGLVLALGYGITPTVRLLALLPAVAVLVAISSGVALVLAPVHVRFRDVAFALPPVLQFWLLLTPVAYPASLVPSRWEWLYSLNPVNGPVDVIRWSLLATPVSPARIAVSTGVGVAVALAGLVSFQRAERRFADVI